MRSAFGYSISVQGTRSARTRAQLEVRHDPSSLILSLDRPIRAGLFIAGRRGKCRSSGEDHLASERGAGGGWHAGCVCSVDGGFVFVVCTARRGPSLSSGLPSGLGYVHTG